MIDDLLIPLEHIIAYTDALLTQSELDELERKFIHAMFTGAEELRDLIITLPDLTWERVQEILSFEARSHLASIIGYVEDMLDDPDTQLDAQQLAILQQIQADSEQLLERVIQLSE